MYYHRSSDNLIFTLSIFLDFSVEGMRHPCKLVVRSERAVGGWMTCTIDCVSMLCTSTVPSGSNEVI